ncbi:hypothetical protein PAPHI01_1831 [Pancytospora philotis]|nr:hypothetical protein PAPHI01_1831 [Pancytospora philotis]
MLTLTLAGKACTFSPQSLPQGPEFSQILASLDQSAVPVRELLALAHLYRFDREAAQKILGIALRRAERESAPDSTVTEIRIRALGLAVHHNTAKESDFYALDDTQDRRLDLLKGFYLYRKTHYEDALFSFSKVQYKLGIDICRIKLGQTGGISCIDDPRVRCFADASEWERCSAESLAPYAPTADFLYRIGKSSTYANESNVDVQLTTVRKMIEDVLPGEDAKERYARCLALLEELRRAHPEIAEIYYLVGTVHHLQKDLEAAADAYKLALSRDDAYLPAEFNLKRIAKAPVRAETRSTAICDYTALLSIKNGVYDVVLDNCSEQVRRICVSIIKVNNGDADSVGFLERLTSSDGAADDESGLAGVFDREALLNNLALLCGSQEKKLELLGRARSSCDSKYDEYLRYNVGVLARDADLLRSIGTKEAGLQLALLEKDTAVADPMLRGYNLYMQGALDEAKELFIDRLKGSAADAGRKKKADGSFIDDAHLFSALCLASLHITEHVKLAGVFNREESAKEGGQPLNEAIKIYRRFSRSFYAANGLAVCLALKGRVDAAIKTILQVVGEANIAYYNLGAFYVLKKNYEAALQSFLRLDEIDADTSGLMARLCRMIGDPALAKKCAERGVSGLGDIVADSAAAHGARPSNPLKEEARARKIKELEESRKRLQLE